MNLVQPQLNHLQSQIEEKKDPALATFKPVIQFDESHQQCIEGFEYLSNDDLLIQSAQDLVHVSRSDNNLVESIIGISLTLKEVLREYVSDPNCPKALKDIQQEVTQVLFNIEDSNHLNKMNHYLKGSAFNYFFKPMNKSITIGGQSVVTSLFLADAMTLIGSLEEQKSKIRLINSDDKPNLRDDEILVNGDEVTVVNRLNESSGSFEGVTSLDSVVNPGDHLILRNDSDSHLLIEHSQLMAIIDSSDNPVDPMTRRPLEESSYQLLKPLGMQMRLFVAVDVPYELIRELGQIQNPNDSNHESLFLNVPDKSLFMSIPTDSNGGNPLPIPSAPPYEPFDDIEDLEAQPVAEVYATLVDEDDQANDIPVVDAEAIDLTEANIIEGVPEPSAPPMELDAIEALPLESQVFYKWMYQLNDPLQYQFSNTQPLTGLTASQTQQSITGAIESQGQRTPFVSPESKAIDRFYTHFRNEMNYFKQSSIKEQVRQINSPADLEANDTMCVTVARFIDLLQIKQQFLAYWEYPSAPYNIESIWDQFQLLKASASINL